MYPFKNEFYPDNNKLNAITVLLQQQIQRKIPSCSDKTIYTFYAVGSRSLKNYFLSILLRLLTSFLVFLG